MLLFPYAPMVNLINHAGGGGGDGEEEEKPNARVEWSDRTPAHLLEMSAREILDRKKVGELMLQVVATRDVEEGEEVLIDYGPSWREAWTEHVRRYEAPDDSRHAYPDDFNASTPVLKTTAELKDDPYPAENLMTVCYYDPKHLKKTKQQPIKDKWTKTEKVLMAKNLFPCSVLVRRKDGDGGVVYDVQVANYQGLSTVRNLLEEGEQLVVLGVPREYIRFIDRMYRSDQFLKGAFRHAIGFDAFPDAWKDL